MRPELVIASNCVTCFDEPVRRRLVREWLASSACNLGCIEADRTTYEAAARRCNWAPMDKSWLLPSGLIELQIEKVEAPGGHRFAVAWRPEMQLSPQGLENDIKEVFDGPGMIVRLHL